VAAAVVHGNVTKIKPASSEQSYMLFHLHSLSFSVVKRRILLFFSDSMSRLEAISGFKLEIEIVQNIIKYYTNLANTGKAIILCWIPSHVNIRSNERADTAAKSALSLPITNVKLVARELIPYASKKLLTHSLTLLTVQLSLSFLNGTFFVACRTASVYASVVIRVVRQL